LIKALSSIRHDPPGFALFYFDANFIARDASVAQLVCAAVSLQMTLTNGSGTDPNVENHFAQKATFVFFRVISLIDFGVELERIHELTRTKAKQTLLRFDLLLVQ
jgi:hypothetical protein